MSDGASDINSADMESESENEQVFCTSRTQEKSENSEDPEQDHLEDASSNADDESEGGDMHRTAQSDYSEYEMEMAEALTEEKRSHSKQCGEVVDLEKYTMTRTDEEEEEEEENDEDEGENDGEKEHIRSWIQRCEEARAGLDDEDVDMVAAMNHEDDNDEQSSWGMLVEEDEEADEVSYLSQTRKIVHCYGMQAPNLQTSCHRIGALDLSKSFILSLKPGIEVTETQATGVAWALDRLEVVQGVIFADEPGLGKILTALSTLLAQNNDRAAGKSLWGDEKPTLIVTSFASVPKWTSIVEQYLDDNYEIIPYTSAAIPLRQPLTRDRIQRRVLGMRSSPRNPATLIYVVDGKLLCERHGKERFRIWEIMNENKSESENPDKSPDLRACFGLMIVDESQTAQMGNPALWRVLRSLSCPFNLLLNSRPHLTTNIHLKLLVPDKKWDEMGVPYSRDPFKFDDDDPRSILRATSRAADMYLECEDQDKRLLKIYEVVMLRREAVDVEMVHGDDKTET